MIDLLFGRNRNWQSGKDVMIAGLALIALGLGVELIYYLGRGLLEVFSENSWPMLLAAGVGFFLGRKL